MKKIIIIVIVVIIGLLLVLFFNKKNYTDNGIPVMMIDLGEKNIRYINNHDKERKYDNNRVRIYDGRKIVDSTVTIKGRGNYTWSLNKKPYQIKFEEKTNFLGLESKKFVLLANYLDTSLLRNDFTYSVAKNMNLNYSFTGVFVDLYVDDEYIGNYYVTPKINISSSVVDLKNNNAVLVELDNSYYETEEEFDVLESNIYHDHIVLKDSNSKDYNDFNNFMNKYNLMEEAVKSRNYKELCNLVEIDSFVKYYIIAEFAVNPDSLKSSFFMYQDGVDDKIHVGPIWDFDIGYGLKKDYSSTSDMIIKYKHLMEYDNNASSLLYELLQIPEFRKRVYEIWNDYGKNSYKEEIDLLDEKIKYLNKSGIMNNNKWYESNYMEDAEIFKEWVSNRYIEFNKYIETLDK